MIRSRVTLATIDAAAIAALLSVSVHEGAMRRRRGPEPEAVDETHLGARGEVGEHGAEPAEVRTVESVPVDVARRDHAHRHLSRRLEHGSDQYLADLGLDLLRVVEQGQWPGSVALQGLVVEEDAGNDQRACRDPRPASSAPATNRAPRRRSKRRSRWPLGVLMPRGYRPSRNAPAPPLRRLRFRRPNRDRRRVRAPRDRTARRATTGAARGSAPSCRRGHGGSTAWRD